MTVGAFAAEIGRSFDVLRKLRLGQERNQFVRYDDSLPGLVREMSYTDEFTHYSTERLFDVVMVDGAMFQFKPEKRGQYSYCYYQSPVAAVTYEEFVAEFYSDLGSVDEIGAAFQSEYGEYLSTVRLRDAVTPVRFDYSPAAYREGVHPAAHIHIGSGNSIRLATDRLMTPLAFVLFVVRQLYPAQWVELLSWDDAPAICTWVREALNVLPPDLLRAKDRLELRLT